jgi:integrase
MPDFDFSKDQTTRALVTTARPTTRTIYWDRSRSAFGLRVAPTGAASWVYMYRNDARKLRFWTIGTYPTMKYVDARSILDTANAQSKVAEIVGDSFDPQDAKTARRNQQTIGELWTAFAANHVAKKSKQSAYYNGWLYASCVEPAWKNKPLSAIDEQAVGALLRSIADANGRNAPGTARALRRMLSKMFNWGRSNGFRLTSGNPVESTETPTVERSELRFLDDQEIVSLLAALDAEWQAGYKAVATWLSLVLLTAQRPGEVVSMRWADLSIFHPGHDRDETGWWTMGRTKNGSPVMAALSRQAVRWLRRFHDWSVAEHARVEANMAGRRDARPMSAFAFPAGKGKRDRTDGQFVDAHMSEGSMSRPVDRTRARMAGVDVAKLATLRSADKTPRAADWSAHDLRRTARTLMARNRVPKSIAERVLNHTEKGVDPIYDRFDYQDERLDAIQRVGDHVANLAPKHFILATKRRAA